MISDKTKADVLRAVHFGWILFGLVSFPMIFVFRWWAWAVIVFAFVTLLSWPLFKACYFTKLEEKWRRTYDPKFSFDNQAFIQFYLEKFFKIKVSRQALRLFNVPLMLLLLGLSVSVILRN